jgi:hypothetical protein
MKNTLEFDPEVLRRYVNFMNNPDEKTAVEQFGKGDKYFGICVLMSTMPGLPMFGHGQIEGYREKYGMEYRWAKWNESMDEGLVRGHEWRIFPLTHRRYIFAEVDDFLLYDFYTPEGYVNEDVFAYSNRSGDERGLVVYHNKFADTRGWVKTSAAFMDKGSGNPIQKTLGEGLNLPAGLSDYVTFRDYVTHLEYIRPCRELVEKGLFVLLGAYQCHVFLDWKFVNGGQWKTVYEALNGAGVESVQAKFDELFSVKAGISSAMEKGKQKKGKSRITGKPAEKRSKAKTAKSGKGKSAARKKTSAKV